MIFHSIHPNKALTPLPDDPSTTLSQQENEIAWSQILVSRILPLILPPEDLQNPCLHVLVSEVFSDMIVRNAVCGKASEAWVIWEGVTKLLNSFRFHRQGFVPTASTSGTASPINKLEQFGLLTSAEAPRGEDLRTHKQGTLNVIAQVFWSILQFTSMLWLAFRILGTALMQGSSIPERSTRGCKTKTNNKLSATALESGDGLVPKHTIIVDYDKPPIIGMKIWTCLSRLMLLDQRMPWLSGCLSLVQWLLLHGPGQVCSTNGPLDR